MTLGVNFFATREDILPGLRHIEQQLSVVFYDGDLLDTNDIVPILSLSDIETVGISQFGNHCLDKVYEIVPTESKMTVREVIQYKGWGRGRRTPENQIIKYQLVHAEEPFSSVGFRPGGLYKDECLIDGAVWNGGEGRESLAFYRQIRKILLKGFKHVNEYWLGPEAFQLLKQGFRLCSFHDGRRECDFRL
ncbi:MAG: hypothetical protein KatS3mg105_4674 [Gemmatales bacterium]|nr:MAG: hypothetical protein KatS3mg105_4674 [Gemmatales bacterium]